MTKYKEQEVLDHKWRLADNLYRAGFADKQHGRDYDPRGCKEWEDVVDMLTAYADLLAAKGKAKCMLTDAELADPEYVRAYIEGQSEVINDLLAAQPVADDMAARVRSCMVCWRCASCRHDLIEMPEDPFGACPACGLKSVMHRVFSIDEGGLIEIAKSAGQARPVAVPDSWRADIDLAAQMLTWGDNDGGLMQCQLDQMAHQQNRLFAMLAAAPSPAAEGAKLPPGFHDCTFSNQPQPIGVVVTSEPAEGAKVAQQHGQDAEDAKRYRWLRTNYPGFTHDMLTGELPESPAEIDDSWRPELDQRIDAAIAASTKGGAT